MLSPIPRQVRENGNRSLLVPSTSAFPRLQMGQHLHYQFRGLLSVHSSYNLQTRRVAVCDPLHRRLRRLRCLHRRSGCYRVERSSSRAGFPPAVEQCLFTAHCNPTVTSEMGILLQLILYLGTSAPEKDASFIEQLCGEALLLSQ